MSQQDKRKEAFRVFDEIDTDKDGKIKFEETYNFYIKYASIKNKHFTHAFVSSFGAADKDNDGMLEFEEFYDFHLTIKNSERYAIRLIGMFKHCDSQKKGYLTIEELKKYHEYSSSSPMSDEKLLKLFNAYDSSKDGKIQLDEMLLLFASFDMNISEDDKTLFKNWFNEKDKEKTGKISYEQCLEILKENGFDDKMKISELDKEIAFRAFSDANDGYISLFRYICFMTFLTVKQNDSFNINHKPTITLVGEYKLMDKENKGKVTLDECAKFISKIHDFDEDDVISDFMEYIDTDGNGTVEMDEYLLFFLQCKDDEIFQLKNINETMDCMIKVESITNPPKGNWYVFENHNSMDVKIKSKSKVIKGIKSDCKEVSIKDFEPLIFFDGTDKPLECQFQLKEYNRISSDKVIASVTLTEEQLRNNNKKDIELEMKLEPKYESKGYKIPKIKIRIFIDTKLFWLK